ncbi:MAG: hypothetical protein Q4P29_06985 [Tissierellia bacterium]|nr:hypothetical protein [Tissierellia bacterium]
MNINLNRNDFRLKKIVSLESFIFMAIFAFIFGSMAKIMGAVNMVNTIMNTAYHLLMNVCWYIMAIAVVAGGLSRLFSEFGIIDLLNILLSKLMKPLYDLPGAASLGILSCYFSDNPAILTLTEDKNFLSYFKRYQLPALTNLGTAFGMGLIITTTMMGMDVDGSIKAALIGNLGAIIGSLVSVRIMLIFTKAFYNDLAKEDVLPNREGVEPGMRRIGKGSPLERAINSMLAGGKSGVDLGLQIVPGVILICTLVLMLTNGPSANGTYTGAANEGVGFLPFLGEKLSFILKPLFGFSSPEAIAVPITALGSAGAAIGLIPNMVKQGLVNANDIAVFTSICMCWSGYLSTHIAMMDAIKANELTGKAIISHTIGGLVAGIASNMLFRLL